MKQMKHKLKNGLVFILAMAMVCGNLSMIVTQALAEENTVAEKSVEDSGEVSGIVQEQDGIVEEGVSESVGESEPKPSIVVSGEKDKTKESGTEAVTVASGMERRTDEIENIAEETTKEVAVEPTKATTPETAEEITEKTTADTTEEIAKEKIKVASEKTMRQAEKEEALREETVTFTVPVSEDDLPDADALFAGYVEKTFYADWDNGASAFGNVGADRLQGEYNQKLYAALKERIASVAAGTQTDTEFVLEFEKIGLESLTWTAADLGVEEITRENVNEAVKPKFGETISTKNILDYLLVDCPYELYWFDKTKGLGTSYSMSYNSSQVTISKINISFVVASEYQSGGNQYRVAAGIASVGQAVARAGEIVAKYQGKSDYEKLVGYRQEICALVSYNHSAADNNTNTAYGNPWQLIWVFDGDESTGVVCEGYSKAFQYLCDMSDFTDAACYTVTGTMGGGTGAGPHMWNIVRLGQKSYLVDVTNCDTGSVGADDLLFLAGAAGGVDGGYTVICNGTGVTYTYDPDQKTMYGSDILTLSSAKYAPKEVLTVNADSVTVTYGDVVSASVLSGTAITSDGTTARGSFSWASDVTSYGNVGTKTLKAVFRPENADYDNVETEVTVTVNKKLITVEANAANKTYGEADPELTYQVTAGGLVSGDSLTGILTREQGENVKSDGYEIGQGTLTNPNYEIKFISAVFTIQQRPVTVSAGTCKVSKVYDGTVSAGTASGALAVTGVLADDSRVTVTPAPAAYENPDVGGQSSVEVTLVLGGNKAENYRLASDTLEVPCEITPKNITPAVEIKGSYQYTGEAVIPTVTVRDGETPLRESDYEILLSDNVNAGGARVEIRAKEGGNYTWTASVTRTFIIEKVSYTKETTASLSVRYGGGGTYDLAALLPEGARLGAPALADSDGVLTGVPDLNGAVLSYSSVNSQENVGKKAEITIPVTESANYLPFKVTVILTVSDKLPQTEFGFGFTARNKSYGDEDFTLAAAGAADGSEVTYASGDAETATVDDTGKVHILRPGTAVITATAAETGDYHEGIASYTLNIAPAALTWDTSDLSAADRRENVDKDSKIATLFGSLKVSGILEGDAAEARFVCAADQLKGVYGKVEPGAQKVALTWADEENPAVLQGTKASYYTLPPALPEISGVITEVTDLPVVPPELKGDQYKLTSESGITEVPEALKGNEELNTPEKIAERMRDAILKIEQNSVLAENVAVYELTLMIKSDDGEWEAVTPEDFPKSGITVTLPYPARTGKDTHMFTVAHMITTGAEAGKTESLTVTNTADGIQFKVYSLSPVAIGWKEVKQDKPADTNQPGTGTDQNTGNKDPGTGSGNNNSGSDQRTGNGNGSANTAGNGSGDSGNSGNQNSSNTGDGANAGTNTGAVSGQNAASANTGDESLAALHMLLFLAAGGILLGYAVRRRKNSFQ